jgi:hypothetical protein
MLLPLFEVEAIGQDERYYGDRIFGAIATELRTSSWVPALLALGFATGFIHYLLDRSVYRMSSPQIRMAARGLLVRTGKVPSGYFTSEPFLPPEFRGSKIPKQTPTSST